MLKHRIDRRGRRRIPTSRVSENRELAALESIGKKERMRSSGSGSMR